jgi:hypothetical protein
MAGARFFVQAQSLAITFAVLPTSPFICTKKMTTHLWVSHFFIVQKHKKGLERVGIAGILFNICVLVCWN